MKGFLLDTNICIFALRNKYGVNERLEEIGREQCYVADVTVMELRFGAYKSEKKDENLRIVNDFISKVSVEHRGDRYLSHSSRHTQVPVPMTIPHDYC